MVNKSWPDALLSSDLARLAGVSTDTLRHYERKGVLARPRRSESGYRLYPADALDRVRLIRRSLSVGITLDELASILKLRSQGGSPCREARALLATKLEDVKRQLEELSELHGELQVILRDWDKRLADTPAGKRAGLLEALVKNSTTTNSRTHRSRTVIGKTPRRKVFNEK
jgi:DNA-binding transcriptional MerR regulator